MGFWQRVRDRVGLGEEQRERRRERREERRQERQERRRSVPPPPPPPEEPEEEEEPPRDPALDALDALGVLDTHKSDTPRKRFGTPAETLAYIQDLMNHGVPAYIIDARGEGQGWRVYCDHTS